MERGLVGQRAGKQGLIPFQVRQLSSLQTNPTSVDPDDL